MKITIMRIFFITIHALFQEINKMAQIDPHQKLMGSITLIDSSLIQFSVLCNPAYKPTNKETDTVKNITSLAETITYLKTT